MSTNPYRIPFDEMSNREQDELVDRAYLWFYETCPDEKIPDDDNVLVTRYLDYMRSNYTEEVDKK